MDVEAASWIHSGIVPPALAHDHDRDDSPMPDAPGENLVRVDSNGSSIESGGSEYLGDRPSDNADESMPDAPPAPTETNNGNPATDEPPPPPPPPPPAEDDPPANANDTTDANATNSDSKQDEADHMPWSPIVEDTSQPGIDEVKRLESSGEVSALDHKHWEKKAFKDLEDPAFVPYATGRIEWTVDRFNGTQEKPNKDLLRYSDPIKIGDYNWRIKLYPKGNGTSYVGAYLECLDFVDQSEAASKSKDEDDDEPPRKKEKYSDELLDAPMPTIGKEPLRRPIQVPVQLLILMYNPQEPRVHFYKKSSHAFTTLDPDRGFSRFGSSPIYDLGLRHPDTRQSMLRNDTLAFIAHVRLFKDPTGFLFVKEDYDYYRDFARTGLRPIRVPADSRGYAANLASAVVGWALLPMMRSLVYRASGYDLKKMPLTKALQEFLAHWRRQPAEDTDETPITLAPMEQVAKALHWHGSCQSKKSCNDRTHVHGSGDISPNDVKQPMRKPWHPAGRGMQEFDVFQAWEFLADTLEFEWQGTEMAGALQKMFAPNGFRTRVSTKSNNIQSALFHQMMKSGQRMFPSVLQVELPRAHFDEEKRKWRKSDDKITIGQTIKLSKDESGWYSLYGLILHDGGLNSRQYSPIVRPNGKNWLKATTYRSTRVVRITDKQAVSDNEARAYIAIYLRADMVQTSHANSADPFKGMPENDWQVPDYLKEEEKPKPTVCECDKCQQDRAEKEKEKEKEKETTEATEAQEDSTPTQQSPEQPTEGTNQSPDGTEQPQTGESEAQPPMADTNQEPDVPQPAMETSEEPAAETNSSEGQEASQNEKQAGDLEATEGSKSADAPEDEDTAMDTDEDNSEPSLEIYEIDYFTSGYYRGTLHKGYRHGEGRRIFANGDVYEGIFKKDQRQGSGNQVYQNGDNYKGEWENDKPHGVGILTTATTGNIYEGGFKDGKKYGEFKLTGKKAETLKGCLVCYVEERDAVFYPCGHMCACLDCARKLEECPYCHRSISESIRLYTI